MGPSYNIMGNTPTIDFVDDGTKLTLIHNATEDELVCSGKIRATDVLIEGTSTTVADLIGEVAALRQDMAAVKQFVGMMPPALPPPPPLGQLYYYSDAGSGFTCANAGYHDQASNVCAAKGGRLCKWDEVCIQPGYPGQQYSATNTVLAKWIVTQGYPGRAKPTDEWVAIQPVMSNSPNKEWIQIGNRHDGKDVCAFISATPGHDDYNHWGCQDYTGYIACC